MTLDNQIPIYIVRGSNWMVEIQLDEDDMDLDITERKMEAATKACELVNGVTSPNSTFELLDGEAPFIGAFLIVHDKTEEPKDDRTEDIVASYVALANGGFYNDSIDTLFILEQELKALQDTRAEKSTKAIQDFEKLQKDEKKASKKKRKKKE